MSDIYPIRQNLKDERAESSNGGQTAGKLVCLLAFAAVAWEFNSYWTHTINNPDPEEVTQKEVSVSIMDQRQPRPKSMGFTPVHRTASNPAPSYR